jgi:hypothetical protein
VTVTYDIDVVCNGNRLRSAAPAGARGGEWDALRHISTRDRRQLIGCGLLTRRGLAPDQLAQVLADYFGREFSSCEAVEWYIEHARHEARHRRSTRHQRIYRRRNARIQRRGYRSLWHYRTVDLGHTRRSTR